MKEANWLIKNGWPPDQAFSLDDIWRAAFCIINAELYGREFDFSTGQYKPVKP